MGCKWLQTKKNEFREKNLKNSEAVVYSCSTDYLFWEFKKNSSANVSAPAACGVTKYRPHQAVFLSYFFEKLKEATPQTHEKSLMEIENMKEKLSYDLWFSLPDLKVTKVTLKQLSETVLKM